MEDDTAEKIEESDDNMDESIVESENEVIEENETNVENKENE